MKELKISSDMIAKYFESDSLMKNFGLLDVKDDIIDCLKDGLTDCDYLSFGKNHIDFLEKAINAEKYMFFAGSYNFLDHCKEAFNLYTDDQSREIIKLQTYDIILEQVKFHLAKKGHEDLEKYDIEYYVQNYILDTLSGYSYTFQELVERIVNDKD